MARYNQKSGIADVCSNLGRSFVSLIQLLNYQLAYTDYPSMTEPPTTCRTTTMTRWQNPPMPCQRNSRGLLLQPQPSNCSFAESIFQNQALLPLFLHPPLLPPLFLPVQVLSALGFAKLSTLVLGFAKPSLLAFTHAPATLVFAKSSIHVLSFAKSSLLAFTSTQPRNEWPQR